MAISEWPDKATANRRPNETLVTANDSGYAKPASPPNSTWE